MTRLFKWLTFSARLRYALDASEASLVAARGEFHTHPCPEAYARYNRCLAHTVRLARLNLGAPAFRKTPAERKLPCVSTRPSKR